MKQEQSKKQISILVLISFTTLFCSLLSLTISTVKAEDSTQWIWVLSETLVNPNDAKMEFVGGGADPDWFAEERFIGKFTRYTVAQNKFRIDDRDVDHGYEFHNVAVQVDFQRPPDQMIPGYSINLTASFSHGGTAEDAGVGMQFWYSGENISMQPDTPFYYSPWSDGFDGVSKVTYSFIVPPASEGGEVAISASLWNADPCFVIWLFEARKVQISAEDPDAGEQSQDIDSSEQDDGNDSRQVMCDRKIQEVAAMAEDAVGAPKNLLEKGVIGVVIAQMGETVQENCIGGESPVKKGSFIKIGDCIRTGPYGRAKIQMSDRDDIRDSGPSVINIAADSKLCFLEFQVSFRDPPIRGTTWDLIKGAMRTFVNGWQGDSRVSVRTGSTICGIRGSDVLIVYDPKNELLKIIVKEGHVDVISEVTVEMDSLTENQAVVFSGDEIIDLETSLEQDSWERALELFQIRDEDFPVDTDSTVVLEDDIDNKSIDKTPDNSQTWLEEADSWSLGKNIINVLCGTLLCLFVIIVVAIVVIILLRARKNRGTKVKNSMFCSNCSAENRPTAKYCLRCGNSLNNEQGNRLK